MLAAKRHVPCHSTQRLCEAFARMAMITLPGSKPTRLVRSRAVARLDLRTRYEATSATIGRRHTRRAQPHDYRELLSDRDLGCLSR